MWGGFVWQTWCNRSNILWLFVSLFPKLCIHAVGCTAGCGDYDREWQDDEWSPQCRKCLRKLGWDLLMIMARDCWGCYWYKDCPLPGQLARGLLLNNHPGPGENRRRLRDGGRRLADEEAGRRQTRPMRPGDLSHWQHWAGGGPGDLGRLLTSNCVNSDHPWDEKMREKGKWLIVTTTLDIGIR